MGKLHSSLRIGNLEISNRIIMAPLTRCRADLNHVPQKIMADYYAQRASAGLIIAEATMVQEWCSAFITEPGIYSAKQIEAWKLVTDAVHQAGGRIFLQIWHGGRACHPLLNNGKECVAPSAIAIDDETHTPQGKVRYVTPRELRDEEIPEIINVFGQAALNAMAAGFDGVEVHGANGYLIDEFLRDSSNHRSGKYGGSIENRARFLLEVTQKVCDKIGADKVGVRISPLNSYNSMKDSDPVALTKHVCSELNKIGIAYLHLMRSDFFGIQTGDVVTPARESFKGILIGNMGYTDKEANQAVESGILDAVAFGHHFISNPDLVNRIKNGWPLVEPDAATFYTNDAKGYTDYEEYMEK